jgi:hypothetical protein
MNVISRDQVDELITNLRVNKFLWITAPVDSGKTTIARSIEERLDGKVAFLDLKVYANVEDAKEVLADMHESLEEAGVVAKKRSFGVGLESVHEDAHVILDGIEHVAKHARIFDELASVSQQPQHGSFLLTGNGNIVRYDVKSSPYAITGMPIVCLKDFSKEEVALLLEQCLNNLTVKNKPFAASIYEFTGGQTALVANFIRILKGLCLGLSQGKTLDSQLVCTASSMLCGDKSVAAHLARVGNAVKVGILSQGYTEARYCLGPILQTDGVESEHSTKPVYRRAVDEGVLVDTEKGCRFRNLLYKGVLHDTVTQERHLARQLGTKEQ